MKKYLTMGGGAITALSMLLPFTKLMGVSVNGVKANGAGWFYIICGIGIIAIGYLDKKGYYIAGIVVGLLVALLSMKYQSDLKALGSTEIGIGLWMLLLGGLLTAVGCVLGVLSKKKNATIKPISG